MPSFGDREKLSWLSINLYTTRHVDAEGVRNEPFSHEEEINKLVHHEKQMKFRAPLTVGHKHPSSFFFRPGYNSLSHNPTTTSPPFPSSVYISIQYLH